MAAGDPAGRSISPGSSAKPLRGASKVRRNVNGEGSIRRRADGRWEARAYVLTPDGREVRRSVYGHSWDEVHSALTRLQADRLIGRRVTSSSDTVETYLTHWLHDVAKNRVRDTTFDSYEYLIRVYLIPTFGRYRLSALQSSDVRRGLQRLKATCQCCAQGRDRTRFVRAQEEQARRAGRPPRKNARRIDGARCCALSPPACCRAVLSDGTVRAVHRLLRTILQDAVSVDGILGENVARNLRLNYRYRPNFRPWSSQEARLFLQSVRTHRLGAAFTAGLLLGLRRGEVLGLAWSDVDLDRGVLQVRQALQRAGGQLRLGPVKSDGSARFVAIPTPGVIALRDRRDRQSVERSNSGSRLDRDGAGVYDIAW